MLKNFQQFDYKIVKELGSNQNQLRTTYLAEDAKGQVVIKSFNFNLNNNWEQYRNLEREFKVLQKLNHPGIPKYIAHFNTDNACYLIQEYIPAPNLENRAFESEEVWEIAKQILDILDYLENQKIIHKDIKPANILWNGKDAYLIDFGFSSDLNHIPGVSSTFLGSSGFIAPEQLYRGEICHQGDLYGLGVTLFCILSNTNEPSQGFNENYELDFSLLNISSEYKNYLSQLCARKRSNRFNNAKSALEALSTLKASQHQTVELTKMYPKESNIATISSKNEQSINVLESFVGKLTATISLIALANIIMEVFLTWLDSAASEEYQFFIVFFNVVRTTANFSLIILLLVKLVKKLFEA